MRKRMISLLVLAVALFVAGDASLASADPVWKPVDLVVRRSGNALTNQTAQEISAGYIDSSKVYNGATARADTLAPVTLADAVLGFGLSTAAADSLGFLIRVEAIGSQAFATGESLYVAFDGQDGNTFTSLGSAQPGTCMTGAYCGAASLVPGTNTSASKLFNSRGIVSTTASSVGYASTFGVAVGGLVSINGGYHGYPTIRLRIKSDSAVAPVVQLVRYRLWYLASK